MQSMKLILITYAVILTLGILSMVTKIHYFANIAGFIAAIGFMVVFFKDPSANEDKNSDVAVKAAAYKKYWYIVFATGLFFSLIFGTLWNSQMGGM